jgi:hypothetical protein
MKAMLLIFALIFVFIVPEIGLPVAIAWAIWKCRKPIVWLARTV